MLYWRVQIGDIPWRGEHLKGAHREALRIREHAERLGPSRGQGMSVIFRITWAVIDHHKLSKFQNSTKLFETGLSLSNLVLWRGLCKTWVILVGSVGTVAQVALQTSRSNDMLTSNVCEQDVIQGDTSEIIHGTRYRGTYIVKTKITQSEWWRNDTTLKLEAQKWGGVIRCTQATQPTTLVQQ